MIGALLSWPIFFAYLGGNAGAEVVPVAQVHPQRIAQCRLGASPRRADRGDAGRRHQRLQPRPPLQLGLYGGGSEPAALLRLPLAVQLRDADAGHRRQPGADVLRLGRGRPRLLPPDRLLVPQAHAPTPPRSRRSSSTGSAISASRSAFSAPSWCSARSRSPPSSPPRRAWPDRPSASPACGSTR